MHDLIEVECIKSKGNRNRKKDRDRDRDLTKWEGKPSDRRAITDRFLIFVQDPRSQM